MYFSELFPKKISIKKAEELLNEYCIANRFGDKSTHWKSPAMLTISFQVPGSYIV